MTMFKKRISVKEVEEGKNLSPKFDERGLIPVITTDFNTKEVLMHGFMNEEALKKTIETKEVHYFSRSRNEIWHKGKTSGFVQKVKSIRIDDVVIQKNISVQSHCEHHMAPILGTAHVAYMPAEKVVGLSKLARVVDLYSRRLQTQERLTMQIANSIYKGLKAHGSAVSIDAVHQCMTTRGVRKEEARTVTNYFTGVFRDSHNLQERFLHYIKK